MSFDVAANAYDRFMGRFSEPLAAQFTEQTGARAGWRALDVGCGPGALTARLVEVVGAAAVCAVDPSPSFVAAARDRCDGVDVRQAEAEDLPFPDDTFHLVAAQLVVHFMRDPVRGLAEMGRVARPGGVVAACVWDYSGGANPLATFWRAVRDLDPAARDEGERPGTRQGHLVELCLSAGLEDVRPTSLTVRVRYETVDEWWEPYTLGVGPAGDYLAGLDDPGRAAVRTRCEQLLPSAPFEITATAWSVTARSAPDRAARR